MLSELLAKVDVLNDMLEFRDHPNQCIGLFDSVEIAIAIKCICSDWFSSLSVISFISNFVHLAYDFNNNIWGEFSKL